MISRDNDAGVAWGERAVTAARQLGDVDTLVYGLNMVGTSHVMAGRIEQGMPLLLESLELARREGLESPRVPALIMLGSGLARDVRARARGALPARECVAFAEAHELALAYPTRVARARRDLPGPLGRGRGRAPAPSSPARSSRSAGSARSIALGRVRARRGDPGALGGARRGARARASRAGTCSGSGTSTARGPRRPGSPATASAHAEEARAVYALALEKRHLWFGGELAYWQWKAGALDEAPAWIAEPYRLQLAETRAAPPPHGVRARARTRRRVRSRRRTTRRRCSKRSPSSTGSARPGGEARAAGAPRPGQRRPARAAARDARQSGGAHRPRGRGAAAPRRRESGTRRSLRALVLSTPDGRPPRLGDPPQARGADARRGRRRRRGARAAPTR